MSLMMTISSSQNGGHSRRSGTKGFSIRDSRSFLTVLRCGTPLSAQEVAQGYKTVKEKSAVVRFKVVGEDAYFLAWTTTPWTLPNNVALCVNPDDTYLKVKAVDGFTYYLAEALAGKVLSPLLSKEDEEGRKKAYEVLGNIQRI